MFTTAGPACATAVCSDSAPRRTGTGAAWVTGAAAGRPRAGSHSGRNVETTNRSATAIVVVCEKMSHSRRMAKLIYHRGCAIRSRDIAPAA